jgi:hypothetical protein
MPNRTQVEELSVSQIIVNAVKTATATSSAVNLAGFDAATIIFDIGNSADTLSGSVYWTLSLTECDTSGGTYTAVAAADILGWAGAATYVIDAPAEDTLAVKVGYAGGKQYVKAVATATGTHSTGTPIGAVAVLGLPSHAPVA